MPIFPVDGCRRTPVVAGRTWLIWHYPLMDVAGLSCLSQP